MIVIFVFLDDFSFFIFFIYYFFKVVFSMVVRKSSFIAPGQILTARRKDWKESKQYNEDEVYGLFRNFAVEYINYVVRFKNDCKNSKAETLVNIGISTEEKTHVISIGKALLGIDVVVISQTLL